MKIARFADASGRVRSGIVREKAIEIVEGDALGPLTKTGESVALPEVRLLAPVVPVNLLCIGRNYKAHAEELGNDLPKAPLLFLKATTALNGPESDVMLPRVAPSQVDFESELAVVIGKSARDVPEENALEYVLGYACANDVSARDAQKGDGQWARGKSFDTFCPLGPWIETELDPADVGIRGRLNGELMQDGRTSQMIFSVPHLVSYLSRSLTLVPGTVILTGTPAGCGSGRKPPRWLKPGDVYEVEIEGVGTLRNRFVAAA